MRDLPTGTVTFLFTDIEGSTRLWEEHPEAMRAALLQSDDLIITHPQADGPVVRRRLGNPRRVTRSGR